MRRKRGGSLDREGASKLTGGENHLMEGRPGHTNKGIQPHTTRVSLSTTMGRRARERGPLPSQP